MIDAGQWIGDKGSIAGENMLTMIGYYPWKARKY